LERVFGCLILEQALLWVLLGFADLIKIDKMGFQVYQLCVVKHIKIEVEQCMGCFMGVPKQTEMTVQDLL